MRGLILSLAAGALALPTPAYAEACPDKVSDKFEKSLGTARAWLNDDEPVYQPARWTKLGTPVAYVIAKRSLRWNGKSYDNAGIERLWFRLQNVQRPSGGAYPAEVRQAFDADYPGSGCGGGAGAGCTAAGSFAGGPGGLLGATLGEGDLYVRDKAYGPALDLIRADAALDADPAFLVCEYQPAG